MSDPRLRRIRAQLAVDPGNLELQEEYLRLLERTEGHSRSRIYFPNDLQRFLSMIENSILEGFNTDYFAGQSHMDAFVLNFDDLPEWSVTPFPVPQLPPVTNADIAETQQQLASEGIYLPESEIYGQLLESREQEQRQLQNELQNQQFMQLPVPVIYQYDPNSENMVNLVARVQVDPFELGYTSNTYGQERANICCYFNYNTQPFTLEYVINYLWADQRRVRLRNLIRQLLHDTFGNTHQLVDLEDPDFCPQFPRRVYFRP